MTERELLLAGQIVEDALDRAIQDLKDLKDQIDALIVEDDHE